MIISLNNLRAGIKWWRDKRWGQDFLNVEYYAIYDARSAGATNEWWDATVNRLANGERIAAALHRTVELKSIHAATND